jgi:AraC-like DNA-binding protein
MAGQQGEYEEAVRRMKEYISLNLRRPITSMDISKAAGYSQYHAARIFKKLTGVSAFEYIRRERLLSSARALRSGNTKVLDVALDFVFDSHEGFTRAFSNGFGITPKRYSAQKSEGWLVPAVYLDRRKKQTEDCTMDSKTTVIFTQILERPERKLILRRSKNAADYFSYCEEVGCGEQDMSAPWDVLCKIKEALYEPVGLWLPPAMRAAEAGVYAHGVEVPNDYTGEIPEGFEIIPLPPCKMLVFQGEPYDDKQFGDAVGACMERIESFNPEVYGYRYAPELAPRMQLSPEGWRGYIEMRAIEIIPRG